MVKVNLCENPGRLRNTDDIISTLVTTATDFIVNDRG